MQYTPEALTAIVYAHGKWRCGEESGKRADLRGRDLSDADLRDKQLHGADLSYSDLTCSNLSGANLGNANLRGADLRASNLRLSDLREADLSNADLCSANLSGADLRDAIGWQSTEWSRQARQQIRYIFSYLLPEIPSLIAKIKEGKIDGTQDEGGCFPLVVSLSAAVTAIPDYAKGPHNPAEQLFWQIREGDTPENSEFSAMALELCLEFCPQESENHES